MRMLTSLPVRPSPSVPNRGRWLWLLLPGFALLLIWPLQALTISMVALSGLMLVSILEIRAERNQSELRATPLLPSIGALFAVAVVLAFVWPSTLAGLAFILLLGMCLTWSIVEFWPAVQQWLSEQARLRRERAHAEQITSSPSSTDSLVARRASRHRAGLLDDARPGATREPTLAGRARPRVPKAS